MRSRNVTNSQKMSLCIRLSPEQDDRMYGVFQITGSGWRASVSNIYGEFQASKQLELLTMPTMRDLFFYGNKEDFAKNFPDKIRARRMAETIFQGRLVGDYAMKTPENKWLGGWAIIHLEELGLDFKEKELLRQVLDHSYQFLDDLPKYVTMVEVLDGNGEPHEGVVSNLRRFPPKLSRLVLGNGILHKANMSDSYRIDRNSQPSSNGVSPIIPGPKRFGGPIKSKAKKK
ncbi:MAG: hypothetical protein AABW89_03800 [Nanoarchaeota archaeon]